jgi:predicted phage tail protein
MNRKIILKGQMGKLFGEEHNLNVRSVQEAMHAIDVIKGGLRRYLMECTDQGTVFTVQKGKAVKDYTKENMSDFLAAEELSFIEDEDIIITPVPSGAASKLESWAKIIIGAILMIISLTVDMSGQTAAAIFSTGMQLALKGIIELTTPDPDSNNEDSAALFNGPVNTSKTGVPIPMAYGKVAAGGVVTNFAFTKSRIQNSEGYTKSAYGYNWNL